MFDICIEYLFGFLQVRYWRGPGWILGRSSPTCETPLNITCRRPDWLLRCTRLAQKYSGQISDKYSRQILNKCSEANIRLFVWYLSGLYIWYLYRVFVWYLSALYVWYLCRVFVWYLSGLYVWQVYFVPAWVVVAHVSLISLTAKNRFPPRVKFNQSLFRLKFLSDDPDVRSCFVELDHLFGWSCL